MFHERLKELRTRKRKTQKDLADYLSISPQSVSKWENGEALPSLEYLPKIAEYFQCDIGEFFAQPKQKDDIISTVISMKIQLNELKRIEPKGEDEDAYNDWLEEYEGLKDILQRVKTLLEFDDSEEDEEDEEGEEDEEDYEHSLYEWAGGNLSYCLTEKFERFFFLAKQVLIDGQEPSALNEYFNKNVRLKENILYLLQSLLENGFISISIMQRKMNMGFNKAGKVIDNLETLGLVSPFDGAHPRQVNRTQLKKLKAILNIS